MSDLKRNIARRKRWDVCFALLGVALIVCSLGTLSVLIGQLVSDGTARLFETAYFKEDGQAPGRREVVGRVEAAPTGEGGSVLRRADLPLDVRKVKTDLAPLDGKRVVVTGSLPGPDEPMEAEKVVALPDPGSARKPPRIGRRDVLGTLRRGGDAADDGRPAWTLVPEALRLRDAEGQSAGFAIYDGKPVAVAGKRNADGSMTVESVERLVERSFFTSMPSRKADRAGIYSAWVGSLLVMLVTVCTALPLGVAAGIYLEEYARKSRLTALIEINIANLAGVPSIIWGLMALGLFIYQFGTERSILTAGLTLGLLVLPIVIIATREAIRSVPAGIRDASIALGATKWETVRHHVLPYSLGGILTGVIVGMSRAIGETAPLITIGALTYVAFLPDAPVQGDFPFVNFQWLRSPFTVLPIQMFNWISRPDRAFHENAAAAGVVLIFMTLSLNAVAIYLRYRLRRSIKW
jgi:phosphate transport system permease protein